MNRSDEFGWSQEYYPPGSYDIPAFQPTDVVNTTRRGSAYTDPQQPQGEIIGPVHGQARLSPWQGNAIRNMTPQTDEPIHRIGPVYGAVSAPISWRQWLAAVEVPESSIASQVFASVRDFPYAFQG